MAAPKLQEEHKQALITWLAAEYSSGVIQHWFREREWPEITRQSIQHYRDDLKDEITQRRDERRSKALTTGLALKEERVERLKDHADHLEEIKWVPDKNGKLWNEKGWRETLDDIAREMGHRRIGIDADVGNKSDAELVAEATRTLQGTGPARSDDPGS